MRNSILVAVFVVITLGASVLTACNLKHYNAYCAVPNLMPPMPVNDVSVYQDRVWVKVDGRSVSFPAQFCIVEEAASQ